MIDINLLKGIIVSRGLTQKDVAKHLKINQKTFYEKMKKGVFGSDEMESMIELLSIDNPTEVFFTKKVTCWVTKIKFL